MSNAGDLEKQLLGVWKVDSLYTEDKTTGEKKKTYGERPNGYAIFAPGKRMLMILTAEARKVPITDGDRVAAFLSMVSYSGVYRVEGDTLITKADVSWNESWIGTEQARFVQLEGETLTANTPWMPDPNTPGNPVVRFVVVWSRVKAAQ